MKEPVYAGAEIRLRRVPDIVSPAVMAKVPGCEERSKRMLAEYGAPAPADAEWADGIIYAKVARPFRWPYSDPSRRILANPIAGTAY